MFQEGSHKAPHSLIVLSALFFIGFLALVLLPNSHSAEEPSINMVSAPSMQAMQSMRNVWQPSRVSQFMQPVQSRNVVAPVKALPEANAEQGRRGAMSAFFGLAAAAASNRPANAADSAKKSGPGYSPEDSPASVQLPPAGDYTRFDATVYKERNPFEEGGKKREGKVELTAPGWVLPGLGAAAILTAGVPAILSPGEEAFKAQRRAESGQRQVLKKNRDKVKQEGKKQWWGASFARQKP